jgi:hypothetical protein
METLVGQIIAIIDGVGVRSAEVVVQQMHVGSSMYGVMAVGSDRTELQIRGLRRVLVLGNWCGRHEVEGGT